jgi:hypothetical protein
MTTVLIPSGLLYRMIADNGIKYDLPRYAPVNKLQPCLTNISTLLAMTRKHGRDELHPGSCSGQHHQIYFIVYRRLQYVFSVSVHLPNDLTQRLNLNSLLSTEAFHGTFETLYCPDEDTE